jgi:hypothetical protein
VQAWFRESEEGTGQPDSGRSRTCQIGRRPLKLGHRAVRGSGRRSTLVAVDWISLWRPRYSAMIDPGVMCQLIGRLLAVLLLGRGISERGRVDDILSSSCNFARHAGQRRSSASSVLDAETHRGAVLHVRARRHSSEASDLVHATSSMVLETQNHGSSTESISCGILLICLSTYSLKYVPSCFKHED